MKYIVIEGLEGAGKLPRNVVVETLEQLGIRDMVFTREHGHGTQLAEKLRSSGAGYQIGRR